MTFSPGRHFEAVPADPAALLAFRDDLLAEDSRACQRELAAMCSEDLIFYTNAFVWQFNPTKDGSEKVAPFRTWECQEEALRKLLWCVENGKDAVMEKSREMGASWMCLILFEWLWHFQPWNKFLVVSKDEKSVEDKADADSLFWKIDFLHDHLPPWLLPAGYDPKVHRRHGKAGSFFNPATKSSITGTASTGRAGVGGRATAIFVDEFSQIKEDREVLHRTSNTSRCRIFNGTHLGVDTALYELTQRPDIEKIRLHWTQHPDKFAGAYSWDARAKRVEFLDPSYAYPPDYKFVTDGTPSGGAAPGVRSPYYDEECTRKGSARAVAMDLDIDAAGATDQFYDAVLIRHLQAQYGRDPAWKGDPSVTEAGKVNAFTEGGSGKLWLWDSLTIDGTPRPGRYAAGADTSEGRGRTPSVLSIVDAVTGRKVAAYANALIEPTNFGTLAAALCRAFCDETGKGAMLAWEAQGPGEEFALAVLAAGYTNIYFRTNEFTLNKKQTDQPGWYPSPANKRLVHGQYRDALRQRQFENPDSLALDECLAFTDATSGVDCEEFPVRGDPSGATTCHGDRAVADALAWMMKLKILAPLKAGRVRHDPAAQADTRSLAGRRAFSARLAADREE